MPSWLGALAVLLAGVSMHATAVAESLTWTGSANSTWNTTSENWSGAASLWTAGSDATFSTGGSNRAITVGDTQSVGNLTVSATGYSLSSGTIATAGLTTWAVNDNFTINSALLIDTAAGAFQKNGAGALELYGTVTQTGTANRFFLNAGTVDFHADTSFAAALRLNAGSARFLAGTHTLNALQGGNGVVVVDGASVTAGPSTTSNGANGGFTVTSGTLTINGALNAGATSVNTGFVNLDGGLLAAHQLTTSSTNQSRFTIKGGTFRALTNQATNLFALDNANANSGSYIGTGGATIDTNGFNVVQTQPLRQNGSETGGLTKIGLGTLTLAGSNSFTGGTTLNAGVLSFAAGGLGSTGAITLNSGTLRWASGNTQDISDRLVLVSGSTAAFDTNGNAVTLAAGLGDSTTANLVKAGGGRLELQGSNGYSGSTTITSGTLRIGGAGQLGGGDYAAAISNSGVFDYASSADQTLSGGVNGTGSLLKSAASTLTLSGSGGYSGGSTVSEGTLRLTNTAGAGTGTITLAGGTLSLFRQAGSGTTTFANRITAAADSSSVLTLDGSGTNGTSNLFSTGTIAINGSLTVGRPSGGTGHTSINALIVGSGTLVVDNMNGGVLPSPSSASLGRLQLAGGSFDGSLVIRNGGNFNAPGNFTFASGQIDDDSYFTLPSSNSVTTFTTLNGSGFITRNNQVTGTATVRAGSGTFSGVISESLLLASGFVGFTKINSGTFVLSGANTYTGDTLVSQGTLLVDGSIASSLTSVQGGAMLGGSGFIAGRLAGSGLVSPGNSPGILTAAQFDPTEGLGAAFEFTALAPSYGTRTASVNDILRLTNATDPFSSAAFSAANVIDVYFNVDTISVGNIFEGGFFTGLSAGDLVAALDGNATFAYWAKTAGAGTRSFNGVNYVDLFTLEGIQGVSLQAAFGTKDFGGTVGEVTGSVTQFVIVPEPDALTFTGLGAVFLGFLMTRSRRCRAS